MKYIIAIAVLIAGYYLWSGYSENRMQASYCEDEGGTMTERGCVVPMTQAQCESHGGILTDGQCVKTN